MRFRSRAQSLWRHRVVPFLMKARLRPRASSPLKRLGTDYGGWWVPLDALRPGALAFCAGAGEDISFDLALHESGLDVVVFDPTPRAIAHVATHSPKSERFRFEPIGWWSEDTILRFYSPADPAHVSHSAVNLQKTSTYFEASVETFASAVDRVDKGMPAIVKMDIEGAEYEVLDTMIDGELLPPVLCVEFDQPQPVRRTLDTVARLTGCGMKLQKIEKWNYTFARD